MGAQKDVYFYLCWLRLVILIYGHSHPADRGGTPSALGVNIIYNVSETMHLSRIAGHGKRRDLVKVHQN